MSDANRTPDEFAQGTPADINLASGQTRIVVAEVRLLEARIGDIKEAHTKLADKMDCVPGLATAVATIKDRIGTVETNARSDHRFVLIIFGAGFLALGGMIISSYLMLSSQVRSIAISGQRIETRLDDLLARIPPAQTPIPTKR